MPLFGDLRVLEGTLNVVFGKKLQKSRAFRKEMWQALANVVWFNDFNPEIKYMFSFRSANDFVCSYSRKEDDTYYMCGPSDNVTKYIAKKMKEVGWSYA